MFLQNKPDHPLHSHSTAHTVSPAGKQEVRQHPNITVCPSSDHGAGGARTPLSEGRQGPLAELLLIHARFRSPWSTTSSQHSPPATGLTELQAKLHGEACCCTESPGAASAPPASLATYPQQILGASSLAQVQGGGLPTPT